MMHLVVVQTTSDTFITGLFALEAGQLKILGKNFSAIGHHGSNDDNSEMTIDSIKEDLTNYINHNWSILKLIKKTEDVFTIIIIVQCCTTAFMMCITIVMIASVCIF